MISGPWGVFEGLILDHLRIHLYCTIPKKIPCFDEKLTLGLQRLATKSEIPRGVCTHPPTHGIHPVVSVGSFCLDSNQFIRLKVGSLQI